jgi:hypothetical protein
MYTQAVKPLEEQMALFLDKGKVLYGGNRPTTQDHEALIPKLEVEEGTDVNASLYPFQGGLGIMATDLFIQVVQNATAKIFVVGHELGHGMSWIAAQAAGLTGQISPKGDEVIADLISAYILGLMGVSHSQLTSALKEEKETIFNSFANAHRSGQHPSGDDRIAYIDTLDSLLGAGHSFTDALQAILPGVN